MICSAVHFKEWQEAGRSEGRPHSHATASFYSKQSSNWGELLLYVVRHEIQLQTHQQDLSMHPPLSPVQYKNILNNILINIPKKSIDVVGQKQRVSYIKIKEFQ